MIFILDESIVEMVMEGEAVFRIFGNGLTLIIICFYLKDSIVIILICHFSHFLLGCVEEIAD